MVVEVLAVRIENFAFRVFVNHAVDSFNIVTAVVDNVCAELSVEFPFEVLNLCARCRGDCQKDCQNDVSFHNHIGFISCLSFLKRIAYGKVKSEAVLELGHVVVSFSASVVWSVKAYAEIESHH